MKITFLLPHIRISGGVKALLIGDVEFAVDVGPNEVVKFFVIHSMSTSGPAPQGAG